MLYMYVSLNVSYVHVAGVADVHATAVADVHVNIAAHVYGRLKRRWTLTWTCTCNMTSTSNCLCMQGEIGVLGEPMRISCDSKLE